MPDTAVNSSNILTLADFIESRQDLGFNMNEAYTPTCGSPGCIGGFSAALWPPAEFRSAGWDHKTLCAKLGITSAQHGRLCYPVLNEDSHGYTMKTCTRETAVAVLRKLATTGKVTWPKLVEPAP